MSNRPIEKIFEDRLDFGYNRVILKDVGASSVGAAGGGRPYCLSPAVFIEMLELPKTTKGRAWRVRVSRRLKRLWGYCDYDKREIVISRDCEEHGVDRQVFLHEMIHKICPWMAEDAVDHLATILDDSLEYVEKSALPRRFKMDRVLRVHCPWMTAAARRSMIRELCDSLDLMEL